MLYLVIKKRSSRRTSHRVIWCLSQHIQPQQTSKCNKEWFNFPVNSSDSYSDSIALGKFSLQSGSMFCVYKTQKTNPKMRTNSESESQGTTTDQSFHLTWWKSISFIYWRTFIFWILALSTDIEFRWELFPLDNLLNFERHFWRKRRDIMLRATVAPKLSHSLALRVWFVVGQRYWWSLCLL
jgi:hypothetical protein